MIEYIKGDLLEAPEHVIVHGCNCQGAMNSGVAKAIRAAWPVVYDAYRYTYEHSGLHLGGVVIVPVGDGRYVINGLTQEYYGRDPNTVYVSYDAMRSVMKSVGEFCLLNRITDIAMPKIGAGLANGSWDIISSIIDEELKSFNVKVYVL